MDLHYSEVVDVAVVVVERKLDWDVAWGECCFPRREGAESFDCNAGWGDYIEAWGDWAAAFVAGDAERVAARAPLFGRTHLDPRCKVAHLE